MGLVLVFFQRVDRLEGQEETCSSLMQRIVNVKGEKEGFKGFGKTALGQDQGHGSLIYLLLSRGRMRDGQV